MPSYFLFKLLIVWTNCREIILLNYQKKYIAQTQLMRQNYFSTSVEVSAITAFNGNKPETIVPAISTDFKEVSIIKISFNTN